MSRERLIQLAKIGLIIVLLGLMAVSLKTARYSQKPFETVLKNTLVNVDMDKYPQKDILSLRRYFGLDPAMFENSAFYRTDDAMDAQEIVLVHFDNAQAGQTFAQKAKERQKAQTTTYEGYAPDQFAMMQNARLVVEDNYALYVVGPQSDQIVSQFEKAL